MTITQSLLHCDTLPYSDLERLLLYYPEEYGQPMSPELLKRLILPRLDTATDEEYLLLCQHLLRRDSALLPRSHKIRYVNEFDRLVTPLLPKIKAGKTSSLPGPTRLILSQASDLLATYL